MTKTEIKTSISGSFFKFKPEIDATINEFEGLNVIVLAPDRGWLYVPKVFVNRADMKFRPLPSERGLNPGEIEESFLDAIRKSDFLYVENPEGYVGEMVCFEIGFALGLGKPVFSREKIKSGEFDDLAFKETIDLIKVASPPEARDLLIKSREKGSL